jgi:hypothetical protein
MVESNGLSIEEKKRRHIQCVFSIQVFRISESEVFNQAFFTEQAFVRGGMNG